MVCFYNYQIKIPPKFLTCVYTYGDPVQTAKLKFTNILFMLVEANLQNLIPTKFSGYTVNDKPDYHYYDVINTTKSCDKCYKVKHDMICSQLCI